MTTKDAFFFTIAPDETPPERVRVGEFLRCVDGNWTCDERPVPAGTKLLALSCTQVAQHWVNGKVIDSEWAAPGLSLTDLCDTNNAEIPESSWERHANGDKRRPWSVSYVVYLVSSSSGEKYTFANSTYGAMLALTTLNDRVATMCKLRGDGVRPMVELASKPMKTQHGTKLRPEFKIDGDWRRLGGDPVPQIEQAEPAKLTKVSAPTIKEELDDALPF
jgi:hypothetical protein